MRGHICGGLSVRRGFTIVKWTEQKLNTRNSTESDIVGLNISMPDMMKYILCGGLRIPGHGNFFYQDNKSTILLQKNGKLSSSKITKHINISLIFITDCISKKELNLEWCPTNFMIGYFVAKPTQGGIFKKFLYLTMGVITIKKDIKEIKESEIKKKSMIIFSPCNQST